MANKAFSLKAYPETEFRFGRVSPIDMLGIRTQVDFDNYEKFKTLSKFCLEHSETKVGEKWVPVKTPDTEAYMPLGIDENFDALNEIVETYLREVILPTFHASEE